MTEEKKVHLPMNWTEGKAGDALTIVQHLTRNGFLSFFAGGVVRDLIMNKSSSDIDIATMAKPEDVENLFQKTIPVGKQFGVMVVVINGRNYEVATFRQEGSYSDGRHPDKVSYTRPEIDALRRDFTANGLFYDPQEGVVIDYVGGIDDIRSKVIRAIGLPEQRFEEDKLRLLRAIRFASTLNFQIEQKTWESLCAQAHQIVSVSSERIRDEIVKIFTRPGAGRGLQLLSDSGLLPHILPEVEAMKGVAQHPDYHPEGDVFVHTKLLLEKLESPSLALALGALFHDVGKPATFQIKDGKIKFYEHAPVGAAMTRDIMRRLRFSNQEIEDVSACVEHHMKFADVQKMRSGKLKMFMGRPTFKVELEMHRIDCLSSHGMLDNYHFLKQKIKELEQQELLPKPFINGDDLIACGMTPGPDMKTLLEEVYIQQLEGSFKDRKEALDYAAVKVRERKKTSKDSR